MFIQVIDVRLKDQSGLDKLREMGEKWEREEAQRAPGFVDGDWIQDARDPLHIMGIIRFESAELAQQNSGRPETNEFYQTLVSVSAGEPTFVDGNVLASIARRS